MEEPAPLRWSSELPVISPSAIATKNLRGDKILLPQSALEQLLAAARSRPSTTTARSDPWSYSSSDADTAQQLPNPLIFRLVNPKNKNAVFAGIREFSASEGTLGLSPWLTEALGIQEDECVSPKEVIDLEQDTAQNSGRMDLDGIQIKVEARQLPKGTYVRLRPLEAGYNPDDWKPLLERQLRENFTTLSKGSMLAVKGARGEEFKLLVDKVAPEGDGICVVDTDLEVDIEALDEEQARETLRRIMSAQRGSTDGSSTGGEIDIWKAVEGQVLEGEYVDYVLPSWNKSQPLAIELTTGEDEDALDLFVTPKSLRQRALPRESVHVFGDFSPAVDGVKRIVISPTNVELEGAEQITISVHGYRHPDATESPKTLQYSLRAKVDLQDAKDGTNGLSNGAGEQEHSPDEEQCSNCLQFVPKRTMVLHENFCRRNNVVCPKCKSVFKKGSPEWEAHWHCEKDSAFGNSTQSKAKHDDIFHTERQCPNCEFSTNSMADLARHQTSVCPGKLILCRFCHLEVPQEGDPFNPSPEVVLSGLTAHELADGTRTTECHLCDKIVRLKDMETHLKHHELDKVSRLKPPICRNANCGRTMFGVGSRGQVRQTASTDQASNDIGLCSICFGPLYVSMHDPEGKALKRRIERRYLGQLMTGCGKSHCANPWCKTGRANAGLEAKPSSAREVLPLVKPLLGDVTNMDAPVWFCTDEGSQRGEEAGGDDGGGGGLGC
ncbi:Ubiquitin-protein ligase E3A, N-terminal zinc-binding domain [Fusarium oxysporum f. sp. vasinfectum]|nr:Ubiquitin-protein ligase E3A, N-terminal zinc-binding domain [Fusarium oxysporum f. sp. vasinfectum]